MNSYIGIIRTSCGASFTYIYPIFWTSFSNSFSFRIFPASYIFFQPDRVYILLSVRIHHIIFHRLRWNFFWKFTKNREDSLQKIFFKTYTKNLTKRILISNPISQFSIYSLSSLTTSSKSVISLLPLTCHIPVIPGLIASLALCRGSYRLVSEISGGLVPANVNIGTTFFQK